MKVQVLRLSELACDAAMFRQFKTGYDSSKEPHYKVTHGVPEDAKLVGVKFSPEGSMKDWNILELFFHSESFPDVEDPNKEPSMVIMSEPC